MAGMKTETEPAAKAAKGSSDNRIWSALCYVFPVLVSIIVMVTEKKKDKEVLFHAWQSLILGVGVWIAWFVVTIVTLGLASICFPVIYLGFLFLAYKAYMGERITIPTVSEMAQKQVK